MTKPNDPIDPKPFKPAEPVKPVGPLAPTPPTAPFKPTPPLKPTPPFKPSEALKDSEASVRARTRAETELPRAASTEPLPKDAKDFIPPPTFNELPEFPEFFKPADGQDYKWVPKTAADEAKKDGWTPVARHPNGTPDEGWIMVGKAKAK